MKIEDYATIGFNNLVKCARRVAAECSPEDQAQIEEYIEDFTYNMIGAADVLESGDLEFDLASADSVLWEDGWCYPNDVFDSIYEFTSDVAYIVDEDVHDIFSKEFLLEL